MLVELMPDVAPKHVENFVKLSGDGFYDGTRFHRVIPGFMIQGGAPTRRRTRAAGAPAAPAGPSTPSSTRSITSAGSSRWRAPSDPNSAGSQFFVVHGEAGFLDGQYTVFGKLLEGFDVLDEIAGAATVPGGEGSTPVEPVAITKATVVEEAGA